jgi:hypothetical protein
VKEPGWGAVKPEIRAPDRGDLLRNQPAKPTSHTMKNFLVPILMLVGLAGAITSASAQEEWHTGVAECLGTLDDGKYRVILTTEDGKNLALELRGQAESMIRLVLPEGKVAKVRVKGELRNRTLVVTEYEELGSSAPAPPVSPQ